MVFAVTKVAEGITMWFNDQPCIITGTNNVAKNHWKTWAVVHEKEAEEAIKRVMDCKSDLFDAPWFVVYR